MRKRGKKGLMQIPFGMIFSIILIVMFIFLAVYAVSVFLGWKKCAETGLFKQDLQERINKAWIRDIYKDTFSSSLPSKIKQVCFIDITKTARGKYQAYYSEFQLYEKGNMFFWPLDKACEGQESFEIKHIDIDKITEQDNPYCVDVDGKVEMRIEKDYGESLVRIR